MFTTNRIAKKIVQRSRFRSTSEPPTEPPVAPMPKAPESPVLADLEARKEALYRQIRDAELDREQGKLSQGDWERLDAELRREAIAVLKRIDAEQANPAP